MLNSYTYKSTTETNPVTRVVEKTISPDKVVEMYDKTLEETEKKILRSFVFNDNNLNGVVVELEPNYAEASQTLLIRFTLNGEETIEKIVRTREDVTTQSGYGLLADAIAEKIIKNVWKRIPKNP